MRPISREFAARSRAFVRVSWTKVAVCSTPKLTCASAGRQGRREFGDRRVVVGEMRVQYADADFDEIRCGAAGHALECFDAVAFDARTNGNSGFGAPSFERATEIGRPFDLRDAHRHLDLGDMQPACEELFAAFPERHADAAARGDREGPAACVPMLASILSTTMRCTIDPPELEVGFLRAALPPP